MARRVFEQVRGGVIAGPNLGNVAKSDAKAIEPQDVHSLATPRVPKPRSYSGDGTGWLVFDSHTVVVELTDVIRTKGAAPVITPIEYEGRRPRTQMQAAPLGTATVSLIAKGSGAQEVHDIIVQRCRGNHLLRLYGPMVGPFDQGDVWHFASMPEADTMNIPLNADGTLAVFKMTVELGEWRAPDELRPATGSRVGSDKPRRMASLKTGDLNKQRSNGFPYA